MVHRRELAGTAAWSADQFITLSADISERFPVASIRRPNGPGRIRYEIYTSYRISGSYGTAVRNRSTVSARGCLTMVLPMEIVGSMANR